MVICGCAPKHAGPTSPKTRGCSKQTHVGWRSAQGPAAERDSVFPTRAGGFPEGARLAGTGARGRLRVAHAAGPEATSLLWRGAEGAQQGDPRPRSRLKPVETAQLPQKHSACATSHFRDCPESVRGRRSACLKAAAHAQKPC